MVDLSIATLVYQRVCINKCHTQNLNTSVAPGEPGLWAKGRILQLPPESQPAQSTNPCANLMKRTEVYF